MVVHWKKSFKGSKKNFSTKKNIFTRNYPNDRINGGAQER